MKFAKWVEFFMFMCYNKENWAIYHKEDFRYAYQLQQTLEDAY